MRAEEDGVDRPADGALPLAEAAAAGVRAGTSARTAAACAAPFEACILWLSSGESRIPTAELSGDPFRLYQHQFLQPNTHSAACFEMYKICILLHRSKLRIFVNFVKLLAIFYYKSYTFREFREF